MTETVATPVAQQPAVFTATFTIKVNGIRCATLGELTGVVKKVEWMLTGEESGQKFSLPMTTALGDPDAANFVPLANLTEAEVVVWIEATDTRTPNIKAHIQYVLDKEISNFELASTPMPWAPVVEPLVQPPAA